MILFFYFPEHNRIMISLCIWNFRQQQNLDSIVYQIPDAQRNHDFIMFYFL